jgi:CRISPR/Cas system-associated exonuclease Cas4 (RecB family)
MINKIYEYTPINRVESNGKRHYQTPEGHKVPSVTTILDATKSEESKQALRNWRARVGEESAKQITAEAAGRGTRMHKWLENWVKNGKIDNPGTNPYSIQSHKMANNIIENYLSKHVTEFWGVEIPLYYSQLYAGTTDCIGLWKNRPAILDFKQTNKQKKKEWIEDYFVQVAAYAMAHNITHGTDIKTGVILMCSANYECQEFEIQDDEFEHYSNIWVNKLQTYYGIPT